MEKFQRVLSAALVLAAGLWVSSCASMSTRTAPGHPSGAGSAGIPLAPDAPAGPPAPTDIFGPAQPSDRRVVLMLGPGMATALGAAGALRAVSESGVEIAAIVGMEAGALVGAAFSSSGSINGMDWKLLQLKPEWLEPRRGLGAMFGSGRAAPGPLRSGIEKLFGSGDASQWKIPLWVVSHSGPSAVISDRGPITPALVATLSHPETMADEGQGGCPDGWSAAIERLRQNGYAQPRLWVLSRLPSSWPHRAALAATRDAQAWVAPEDLVIELEPQIPPGADSRESPAWAFRQRSQVTYQARQSARRAIPEWLSRLGWAPK